MDDMFINLAGAAGYGWPTSPEFLYEAFEQKPLLLLFLRRVQWGREETKKG